MKQTIDQIINHIQELAEHRPSKDSSEKEKSNFYHDIGFLQNSLIEQAQHAPKKYIRTFTGVCYTCYDTVKVTVEQQGIKYQCPSCTEILADIGGNVDLFPYE